MVQMAFLWHRCKKKKYFEEDVTSSRTFADLVQAVKTEREVGISGVVLEDAAVGSGAPVNPQAGVVATSHQRLLLLALSRALAQTHAARAEALHHVLADLQIEAQHHHVHAVHQQKTRAVIPANAPELRLSPQTNVPKSKDTYKVL